MVVKLLTCILLICLFGIGYVAAEIVEFGGHTNDVIVDAAIVLGASVRSNEPSPVFKERINHAINLYRSHKVRKLILTGGHSDPQGVADSVIAKQYAIQMGVPAADILTEEASRTTDENLRYASAVAERNGLHSFLIVSDPLHMKRAMAIAASRGLKAFTSPTPTTRYSSLPSQSGMLMRETYFLLCYRAQHGLNCATH